MGAWEAEEDGNLFVKFFENSLFQMQAWVLVFGFPVWDMFQATDDFDELQSI